MLIKGLASYFALRQDCFSWVFFDLKSNSQYNDRIRHVVLQEEADLMPTDSDGNIVLSEVDYLDTWRQMEKCVQLGLTRSIGLSNFNSQQIDRVLANTTIRPVNLQVRVTPFQKLCDTSRNSVRKHLLLIWIHHWIPSIHLSLAYLLLVFSLLLSNDEFPYMLSFNLDYRVAPRVYMPFVT
jgi:hypothetical protein